MTTQSGKSRKTSPGATTPSRQPRGRYAGKSAEHRRQERYECFLEAGIRIIGGKGYDAATLRAVCKEAGLTERYFYESFDNRHALMAAAYKRVAGELVDALQSALTDPYGDVAAMIDAGLDAVFSYLQSNPERGRLLMIEGMVSGLDLENVLGRTMDTFVTVLLTMSKDRFGGASLSRPEQEVLVQGLVGAINYIGQRWIVSGYQQPIDEIVAATRKVCLGIFGQFGVSPQATMP